MTPKNPPSDPFKEQLRKITWLIGDEREDNFVGDVVYLVQNYVTTTNKTISDLQKRVAKAEADAKRWEEAWYAATHRT